MTQTEAIATIPISGNSNKKKVSSIFNYKIPHYSTLQVVFAQK
jgi:hypothetical protein